MKKLFPPVLLLIIFSLAVSAQNDKKPEKLSANEIVARHIASLGDKAALASATTRVMTGRGSITSKIGTSIVLEGPEKMA